MCLRPDLTYSPPYYDQWLTNSSTDSTFNLTYGMAPVAGGQFAYTPTDDTETCTDQDNTGNEYCVNTASCKGSYTTDCSTYGLVKPTLWCTYTVTVTTDSSWIDLSNAQHSNSLAL